MECKSTSYYRIWALFDNNEAFALKHSVGHYLLWQGIRGMDGFLTLMQPDHRLQPSRWKGCTSLVSVTIH